MALIEAVVSMLVISFLFVTALSGVAASRRGQLWNSDALRGESLAMDLMCEILDREYADPNEVPLWGPEPSELAGRPSWDDVDDYDGYRDSPPKDRAGNAIAGMTAWRRDVVVERVTAADVSQTSLTLTGVKRITVTASRNGVTKAKLVALRTMAVSP